MARSEPAGDARRGQTARGVRPRACAWRTICSSRRTTARATELANGVMR